MSYFRMWGAFAWLGGRAGGRQGLEPGPWGHGMILVEPKWPPKATQLYTGLVESWQLLKERGEHTHQTAI